MKTFGAGFEHVPAFDAPLNADASEAVLDLATLKTPPGDYVIALYGGAVAKYRYHPAAVTAAEAVLQEAQQEAMALAATAKELAEAAKTATDDQKVQAEKAAQDAATKQQSAEAAVAAADKQLQEATAKTQPKDIVDIVVSTPIAIRVKPVEKK